MEIQRIYIYCLLLHRGLRFLVIRHRNGGTVRYYMARRRMVPFDMVPYGTVRYNRLTEPYRYRKQYGTVYRTVRCRTIPCRTIIKRRWQFGIRTVPYVCTTVPYNTGTVPYSTGTVSSYEILRYTKHHFVFFFVYKKNLVC